MAFSPTHLPIKLLTQHCTRGRREKCVVESKIGMVPEVSEKSGDNREEERISPGLRSQRIAVVGVESGPEMVSGGSSGEDEGLKMSYSQLGKI